MNISKFSARTLAVALTLLLLAATLLWVGIFAMMPEGAKTTRIEMLQQVAQYLAQFVLVTFIGGTVTFLLNLYVETQKRLQSELKEQEERRRRAQEEERKTRHELLDSLIQVRALVEQARRNFRLVPIEQSRAGYRRVVETILQARLDLSGVWHDTETLQQLFQGEHLQIQKNLNAMKMYLDKLVDEFEAFIRAPDVHDEAAARAQIEALPRFGVFTLGQGGTEYMKEFLEAQYRPTVQMMRRHLLEPGAPAALPEAVRERAPSPAAP